MFVLAQQEDNPGPASARFTKPFSIIPFVVVNGRRAQRERARVAHARWGEGGGVDFTWHNEGRESRQRLSADHQRGKGRGSDVVKLFECAFSSKKKKNKAGMNLLWVPASLPAGIKVFNELRGAIAIFIGFLKKIQSER